MKHIIAIMLCGFSLPLAGQTQTEKITKELSFEVKNSSNVLMVDNVNGSITVEGYSGSTVLVEVEKIITGKTEARLQKGMKEIQLGVIDRADTVILYTAGLCMKYGRVASNKNSSKTGWGYNWNSDRESNPCRDDAEFDHRFNYRIKVPAGVHLILNTINNGDIKVTNAGGRITACNINGHIRLEGIRQAAHANTINGNVDVNYVANPENDCRFYTLNGNINAYFKKGLSSRVAFKSFNGDFYTNLPELVALPAEVEKSNTKKGIKYSINGNRYKTGNGGALLDFETFNGNVYLREQ